MLMKPSREDRGLVQVTFANGRVDAQAVAESLADVFGGRWRVDVVVQSQDAYAHMATLLVCPPPPDNDRLTEALRRAGVSVLGHAAVPSPSFVRRWRRRYAEPQRDVTGRRGSTPVEPGVARARYRSIFGDSAARGEANDAHDWNLLAKRSRAERLRWIRGRWWQRMASVDRI